MEDKEKIMNRIQWYMADGIEGGERTELFSGAVSTGITRYVVGVYIRNAGGNVHCDIEEYNGTTYTPKLAAYTSTTVPSKDFPQTWDPTKPIMKLPLNYSLYASPTGGTVDVMVAFWEDDYV